MLTIKPLDASIASLRGASGEIQNLKYTFDSLGNLEKRKDLAQGLAETFIYDALDRSKTLTTTGGVTLTKNIGYAI